MSHTKDFDMKRNDILDCAEQLFTTKSYELTTVNAILKEVGIAKGTFYYYFESKEEVMDAVIMRIIEDELEYVKTILADKNMSATKKLITALLGKPKSVDKNVIIERMYEANNALMKQRAMQRTLEYVCPLYAKIVEEGNKTNEFSSMNPLSDIQFLIAGIQTLFDLSGLVNSKLEVNIESVVNVIFQILKIDENIMSQDEVKQMMTI